MKTTKLVPALCAGFLVSAMSAFAAEQTFATPPPSEFVDTESSVAVPLADWQNLGRKFKLTLSLNVTPTNALQIAFGRDLNGDEDLEPEETEVVIGCDCGVWFHRRGDALVDPEWNDATSSGGDGGVVPTLVTRTLRLRQPADRWDLAKVTRRGKPDPQASITAEFNPGTHVILW